MNAETLKIFAVLILCSVIGVMLKSTSAPFALLLSFFVSAAAVGFCTIQFFPFFEFFNEITANTAFGTYAGVLVKVCGIGVLTRLAAEICRDAGESSYASKAELVGKTAVLLSALPVIKAIFEQVKEFLN